MRILITNDDGVGSASLAPLIRWAKRFGEVTAVAPKFEQSGKSQAIEFFREIEIKKVQIAPDVEVFSMDSTPADCVRYAVLGRGEHFDLVISGINRGLNLGRDLVYSGTAGAIFEAGRLGIKGIALSTPPEGFAPSLEKLDAIRNFFLQHHLFDHNDLYNVNIPLESHGFRITRLGGIFYTDDFIHIGNDIYIQEGHPVASEHESLDYDVTAVQSGYISITPITAERTQLGVFEKLKDLC